MILYISIYNPYAGFPNALNDIRLNIPMINPNTAATTPDARANGTTGIVFSSCKVPLIVANSNLILTTLVAM